MKKVLIKGYYGYENLGDDFILYTILSTLNSIGKFDVTVVSSGDTYEGIFNLFSNLRCHTMRKPWKKFTKLYEIVKADYWIIGGGGLFPSETSANYKSLCSEIMLAKKCHTKTCMYGIDINSISKPENKDIWKKISVLTDFIVCRNQRTYQMLSDLGCANIIRSSDITFSVESNVEKTDDMSCLEKIGCKKDKYVLWAIPMPWFDNEYKDEIHGERYRKLVHDIQRVANSETCSELKHVFLPFYYNMDMKIIGDIVKGIHGEYVVCDKNKQLSIDEKRMLFKLAKACVCMRFHGSMFALYQCTPLVAISYSNKTSDVIKEYGLERDMIEYGIRNNADFYSEFDLDGFKLLEIFQNVVGNRTSADYKETSRLLKEMATNAKGRLIQWFI